MAIFRAGKRIGPFDIRGGISRGDYQSSAYHKTDKDPRFKMQANTETTIGRFRAAMASAGVKIFSCSKRSPRPRPRSLFDPRPLRVITSPC